MIQPYRKTLVGDNRPVDVTASPALCALSGSVVERESSSFYSANGCLDLACPRFPDHPFTVQLGGRNTWCNRTRLRVSHRDHIVAVLAGTLWVLRKGAVVCFAGRDALK